jgi:hypothetical protein
MKTKLLFMPVLAAAVSAAFCAVAAGEGYVVGRLAAGGLGTPDHADTEMSQTIPLPPPPARNWRLEVELCGTPSNRFECAFGRDGNGDSALDTGETRAVVAWERGVWRVTGGDGLTECREAAAASAATNTLTLDVRLGRDGGAPTAAVFREGRAPLAFAGSQPPAAWLDPRGWDILCVKARGGGVRAESIRVTVFPDGSRVILK